MKWFKFFGQDYLSDPKMLSLSSGERSCWITLLAYASINDDGTIQFLSEQQLMMQAGIDFSCDEWDRVSGVLNKLENLGMIKVEKGIVTILNWRKRQGDALTSYERVKKYRAKLNDNVTETLQKRKSHALEENRKEKNIYISVDQDELQKIVDYWNRFKTSKDAGLSRINNKSAMARLLPRCTKVSEKMIKAYKKLGFTNEELETAIKNYILEIVNRPMSSDYCNHRFSLYEFLKQDNGAEKFINQTR